MDHLSRLPEELLLQLLDTIHSDSDSTIVNQSLLAVRRCSKILNTASDSVRNTITLHPSQLKAAPSYLAKLFNLTSLTICAPLTDIPFVCNLDLVSAVVPNLASLTVTLPLAWDDFMHHLHVPDITQALLPWRHSLTNLELNNCILTEKHTGGSPPPSLQSWSPDLPILSSFKMTNGRLSSLCLKSCMGLCNLELQTNVTISHLGVSGITTLKTAHIVGCVSLVELNLSQCSQLESLVCSKSCYLTRLDVTGCVVLRDFEFLANLMFTSLRLPDFKLLEKLTVFANESLVELHALGCSNLRSVSSAGNPLLQCIKLPQHSFTSIFC